LRRAALESIAYQTVDVLRAMERDAGIELTELRVDGGATRNDLLIAVPGRRARRQRSALAGRETTALGAAYLAASPLLTARRR
jgi:glycerol kinase